jgi:GH15 family glucan-1,4-alpha-glucosidase
MALPIEDYALIGDCRTAALVGKNGSIDWLTVPRFDSGACFAGLLGSDEHGHWTMAPKHGHPAGRRYRDGTLVLETDFAGTSGRVRVIDFMPMGRDGTPEVVRIVEGLEGTVTMRSELVVRFNYGSLVPSVRRSDNGGLAFAGGTETLYFETEIETQEKDGRIVSEFVVTKGERRAFVLAWAKSASDPPSRSNPESALADTERYWRIWSDRTTYRGRWRDAVRRSLITLKALTYAPTGGIVAAPTTSLPEKLGGSSNWDYRYCWLRDATFCLYAFLVGGYEDEARAWRSWLVRSVGGDLSRLRVMYGVGGERTLSELALDWLPGYEGARPVRVGNAAAEQHQLDVYGEVMDAMHVDRRSGLAPDEDAWGVQRAIMALLEKDWTSPDAGMWEVRGPGRQYTHSKILAWVAADRAVSAVEQFGLSGDSKAWRALRETIGREVCERGYDGTRNAFVRSYGSSDLDASLLLVPLVGFLPPSDPRVRGTVNAIEHDLMRDGLVHRYRDDKGDIDGAAFLSCTFWLADNFGLQSRRDEAAALFERLLELRNDVGLLSEEYDSASGRLVGNFPQAFSHVALINTARNLSHKGGPAEHRGGGETDVHRIR